MNAVEDKKKDSREWLLNFEKLDQNGKEIISAMMAGLLCRQRMEEEQKAVG